MNKDENNVQPPLPLPEQVPVPPPNDVKLVNIAIVDQNLC